MINGSNNKTRIIIKSTTDVVADVIRQRIIAGELKPNTKINIEEIARNLDVSPTPVREAIRTLQAERFVLLDPNKGASVRGIELDEVVEIYELRRFLEVYAVKRAVNYYSENDFHKLTILLEKMKEAWAFYPEGEIWELHRKFHRVLLSYENNQTWVHVFLELLWQNADRYRQFYIEEIKLHKPVHQDHRRLLEVAKNRDGELLAELLDKHLEENQHLIMHSMEKIK
jgi:DNA-binding GntR family transcriptional regulator